MKKILAALVLLLWASTANAADNAVTLTPGSGVTMRTRDIGSGIQSSQVILGDIAGAAIYGSAGTANANILSVQGIASMTPLLATVTQSGTWNITNISGTVSLPTGASTSTNQTSQLTQETAINTVLGTQADTVCGTATGTCTLQALIKFLNSATTSAIPAGTNSIGNVNLAVNVTPTTCGGTITTGGTAQNAHTAQSTLHGMTIVNLSTTEVLWFSVTGTAAASGTGSLPLAPATATTFAGTASYTTPAGFGYNTALSVVAATTGHAWSCTRW